MPSKLDINTKVKLWSDTRINLWNTTLGLEIGIKREIVAFQQKPEAQKKNS